MKRIVACLLSASVILGAQNWIDQAKSIQDQVHRLRSLPDAERAKVTKQLAMQIRQLPAAAPKSELDRHLTWTRFTVDMSKDGLVVLAISDVNAGVPLRPSRESGDQFLEMLGHAGLK